MDLLNDALPGLKASNAVIHDGCPSPCEGLHVFDLLFGFEKSSNPSGEVSSFNLGAPSDRVTGALRLTNDKYPWLLARHSYWLPADVDTQVMILRYPNYVLALLPLTTESYMGSLRGPMYEHEHGSIFIRFVRNNPPVDTGKAVITIANNIDLAMSAALKCARIILGKPPRTSTSIASSLFESRLTYCTWNSLQLPTPTCAASALSTLEHLQSIGVRPAVFLLDDGWQHVNSFRTLQSFECPPTFLGEYKNLGEVVKIAKEKYGVRNVGVWHTIQGYWHGVDVREFGSRYKLVKVTKDIELASYGPHDYIPHPDSVLSFFRDYYKAMHDAGITFTKCDDMASITRIVTAVEVSFPTPIYEIEGQPVDVFELRKAYIHAVKTAACEYFGAENVIWCMGMTPRLLLGEVGLAGDGIKRVCRNSDDYFPNEPDSHGYHAFVNAINALLLSNLDLTPDFDMFQTHAYISPQGDQDKSHLGQAQASFHASFRAFGAGPVSITDQPGKSDSYILQKIIGDEYPNVKSPSVVIQASEPFTILDDVFDPAIIGDGSGKALKVCVHQTIGIWNVRGGKGGAVEFISPSDLAQALSLPPKAPLPSIILYIQTSGSGSNARTLVYGSTNPLTPAPPVRVDINRLGWATVGVATFEKNIDVACIGLIDKYLPARGVEKTELNDRVYTVHVRCSGRLGVWVGAGVKVQKVSVNSVSTDRSGREKQSAEYKIESLAKGQLVTVETKGKGPVIFEWS